MTEEKNNVETEGTEEAEENKTALAVVSNEEESDSEGVEEVPHEEVRREIIRLRTKMDQDYWELGVALETAYREDLYREWGFESWKQYVEEEVDVGLRKAQYLVKLQGWFEQMTPAIQNWMRGLGWTKARMLMHVVTQDNAGEWKARVAGKTVAQIEAMIDADKKGDDSGGGSAPGNDEDNENDFVKTKPLTMSRAQKELYDLAMTKAGEVLESEKPGYQLAMVCQQWLALNTDVLTKGDFLKDIERYSGWKLVALGLDEESGKHEIMWGEENLDILRIEDGEEIPGDDEDPDEGDDEDDSDVEDNVGQDSEDEDSGEEESDTGI